MLNKDDNATRTSMRSRQSSGTVRARHISGMAPARPARVATSAPRRLIRLISHPTLQLGVFLLLLLLLLVPTSLFGRDHGSDIAQLFESDAGGGAAVPGWLHQLGTMLFRVSLAALLGALLAFRPRKALPIMHRNPYVTQTQILLAVVGAALMMIVADSAARAFGIFAAASLVRFRTNIRDPKEITVLLINLGIGLAAGVGRWELAIGLGLFVFLLLQLLEHFESVQALRSMELRVKTYNVDVTDQALREMFERNHLKVEIRTLNLEDPKHPVGKIVYRMVVNPAFSTDEWAEEILSSDPVNIDGLEWHQKKSSSFIYG